MKLKLKSYLVLLAVAGLTQVAQADKFYWNNASGGYWDDPSNWTSDSGTGTYPGDASASDNIGPSKVQVPFTITLRKDERAWLAQSVNFTGTGIHGFELDGHKLFVRYLQYSDCGTPAGYNALPARSMEFRNGTVGIPQAIYLGSPFNQYSSCGSLIFSDCIVTTQFEVVGYRSAIVVRDGSKLVFGNAPGVNKMEASGISVGQKSI